MTEPAAPNAAVTPMFPLGTVLFPHALLPLHVFEPRYRVMTRHVMRGAQEFGVVLIERGSEVGGGDVRFDVGTVARIVRATELPDGRFALTAVGVRRMRVVRWLLDEPYPRAEIVRAVDEPALPDDADARDRVETAITGVYDLARRLDARVPDAPALDRDPVRASFEAAAAAPIGALDKQRLLECDGAGARLEMLARLLHDCAADLRARLESE